MPRGTKYPSPAVNVVSFPPPLTMVHDPSTRYANSICPSGHGGLPACGRGRVCIVLVSHLCAQPHAICHGKGLGIASNCRWRVHLQHGDQLPCRILSFLALLQEFIIKHAEIRCRFYIVLIRKSRNEQKTRTVCSILRCCVGMPPIYREVSPNEVSTTAASASPPTTLAAC